MSNIFQNTLTLLKDDILVSEIPVVQNAIAIYQKNPTGLGKAAAIQSLIANAPIALLTAESVFLTNGIATVNALLSAELSKAQADLAGKVAAAPTPAVAAEPAAVA